MSDEHGDRPRPTRVTIHVASLPTLPGPLAELLLAASDPAVSPHDLLDTIARAPSFAAQVLRALEVGSVHEAVQRVGTRGIRRIVSTLAIQPLFAGGVVRAVDPARIAAHGLACALWAGEVARALGQEPPAHVITAALLHDAGVLLLDRHATDRYRLVLEAAERGGRDPAELELELLGTTHGKVGAQLCAKWMLPPAISGLIGSHHDHAASAAATPDAHLLAVANHLAAKHGASNFAWSPPRPVPPGALAALGLALTDLDALAAGAPAIQRQVAGLRGLGRSPGPS